MLLVRTITDPFDLGAYAEHETEKDLLSFLQDEFPVWPETARLYRDAVGVDHDVTPGTADDAEALREVRDGIYYVVVYPGDPITALIAIVGVLVVATAILIFSMPKLPDARNEQASSNNSLGQRVNKPRPNARIPDIFGTVRSTPDMLTVPYRVFENHRELEISYLCIGRGAYLVDDIRDGDTLVSSIDGASVSVFGPYTSPNDPTDVPQIQIGQAIGDPVFDVVRINDVNGQELKAPNDTTVRSDNQIELVDGGIIRIANGAGVDFRDFFQVDDEVELGRAVVPEGSIGAVLVAANATGAGFQFVNYDPTADFSVGQVVSITGAAFTVQVATLTDNNLDDGDPQPDYPYDPYRRTFQDY